MALTTETLQKELDALCRQRDQLHASWLQTVGACQALEQLVRMAKKKGKKPADAEPDQSGDSPLPDQGS